MLKTKTEITGLVVSAIALLEQFDMLSRFDPQDIQNALLGLLGMAAVFLRQGVKKAERAANGELRPGEGS